jgi:hypothetical protein
MLTGPIATLLMLVSLSAAGVPASADGQQPAARPQTSGAVAVTGPVYLLPDNTRTPLRTLAVGTIVRIGEMRADWIQVTFNDGALGLRTGWMERRFLTIGPPADAPAAKPAAPPQKVPPPAQTRPRPPARAPERIGGRVFASVMRDRMSATESFEAVIGRDTVTSFGGGAQATNVWKGLFLEVSIERSKVDGERVFVFDGDVFPLGIPLEIEMLPIDIVGGWRHRVANRVFAYGGGGVTLLTYKETSEFADDDEDIDERYTGFVVLGGVEAGVAQWVHLRGEVRFRSVSDVLGVGGASQAFDETTLGGIGFGVKIVFGR